MESWVLEEVSVSAAEILLGSEQFVDISAKLPRVQRLVWSVGPLGAKFYFIEFTRVDRWDTLSKTDMLWVFGPGSESKDALLDGVFEFRFTPHNNIIATSDHTDTRI